MQFQLIAPYLRVAQDLNKCELYVTLTYCTQKSRLAAATGAAQGGLVQDAYDRDSLELMRNQ